MIRKQWLYYILIFMFMFSCNSNTAKNTEKEMLAYNFAVPKGWATEKISFPIEFAPQISYKGFEDLRFAPGWEFNSSEEHWCYAFVWWLEEVPEINTQTLQENLKLYYNGLVTSNVRKRFIPANKVVTTVATIKKIQTAQGDIETYTGTIYMLDYLDITYSAITLNCLIHRKKCAANTAIVFEISPKPFEHKIWKQLNELNRSFECKNQK